MSTQKQFTPQIEIAQWEKEFAELRKQDAINRARRAKTMTEHQIRSRFKNPSNPTLAELREGAAK